MSGIKIDHQGGEAIMAQGVLPFKYGVRGKQVRDDGDSVP